MPFLMQKKKPAGMGGFYLISILQLGEIMCQMICEVRRQNPF